MADYMERCAQALIVWAPAGYGWQCFRTYEAALCGAVPLLSRATIEQYHPLLDGVHALYYDVEPGGLTGAIKTAFKDRRRLMEIGAAARDHVLAHHTPAAIASHIVEEGLKSARPEKPGTL